jgi:NADH:ubiquinone oxidoreductase subunit 5 (subunit L)/multisubunit Na+/H+ antiporter MnhA subunit
LHVWNHCLFKSLLFLAAGSVVHAAHTREIDQLGGLSRKMPATAALFAIGAVAICGLPPLNGFVSELLIYLGLFRTAAGASAGYSAIALAAPALAMVGALAVACFVKAYGAVFLGMSRSEAATEVHESPLSMIAPTVFLAALCAIIGLFPILVFPLLDHVLAIWPGSDGSQVAGLFPDMFVTTLGVSLAIAIGIVVWLVRRTVALAPGSAATWDCGYIRPRATMQYTSSSFASTLVGMFRWILRPAIHREVPVGLFPGRASFSSHVSDIVLDGLLNPFWDGLKSRLASARVLQQGRVQRYLLYILLALFGLLMSMVSLTGLARKLLGH